MIHKYQTKKHGNDIILNPHMSMMHSPYQSLPSFHTYATSCPLLALKRSVGHYADQTWCHSL